MTPPDNGPDPAAPNAPAPKAPAPRNAPAPRPRGAPTVNYKGEPLEAARGPGLGCFWIQAVVLGLFVILTPLSVAWDWPVSVSAGLLIAVLVLLLFVGQTRSSCSGSSPRTGVPVVAPSRRPPGRWASSRPKRPSHPSRRSRRPAAACQNRDVPTILTGGSAPCASPGDLFFRSTRP